MTRTNAREEALFEVQTSGFALYDSSLFLDTHPCDREALAAFSEYRRKYGEARAFYEQNYGPLNAADSQAADNWAWIKGPWPWETEA